MYAAIGFLSATLLALLTLPAVWRRAVRLTRRRMEAAMPISVTEFQAEKDEMRAAFALEARRQEMDVGELRERTAEQWAQISRQTEDLRLRQIRLDETSATLAALEIRHGELERHDQQISTELDARTSELATVSAALDITRRDLAEARAARDESQTLAEELQVENVTLTTVRDTLSGRVADLEHRLARTTALLEEERAALRTTTEQLATERSRTADLGGRLSLTESSLAATSSQAALVSAELSALRINAELLEARSAAVEKERDEVRAEAERSNGLALSYQRAAETSARQSQDQVTMLQAEKAMLEGALAKAREERNALQSRLDAGLPVVPGAPAVEDAGLLRRHISEVAAQVARITAALEGPGSPVTSLLVAGSPARKNNGAGPTLADRIRALQEQGAHGAPVNGQALNGPSLNGQALNGQAATSQPAAGGPPGLVPDSPPAPDHVAAG
nr:hypothetical protein [Ancylobacter gelatini]